MTHENQTMHVPVMPAEVVEWLAPQPGKVIVDGTVGLGGHARRIVQLLLPGGLLIGLDRDAEALKVAGETLAPWKENVRLFHLNYTRAVEALTAAGVEQADGVVYDLGVSQLQLKTPGRGFSFTDDAPLDMRMDVSAGETAAELIRRLPEPELERIIREYGEERYARRVARRIVEARRRSPITTTADLARLVAEVVPPSGRIAPQTRTFQALRIAVNHELEELQSALGRTFRLVRPGGRVVAIAFHSLEDRIVKNTFREQARQGIYRILTRKPLRPSREEVLHNRASRSARLRAAERTQ